MTKKCIICNKERNDLIRFNSMEIFMRFRVKNKLKRNLDSGFICFDCREQLRKELEKESGIKII